jgi:type I restriction enzyme R subunit
VAQTANVFTGDLITLLDNIRRDHEQTIDHDNLDTVLRAEWDKNAANNAQGLVDEFVEYLTSQQDSITALTIYFSQPYRRRELSFDMIREVLDKLKTDQPKLAPMRVWQAYRQLDAYKGEQPMSELTALVALIRRVCGLDSNINTFDSTVRRNFQNWIMKHHSGGAAKFNEAQMDWLRMVRDHVANSFHIEKDDLEMSPFDAQGGLGKMHQLFGNQMDSLLDELNEVLVA